MEGSSINPWASETSLSVERLFAEFGIEPIDQVVDRLPEKPMFFRRGIVFGHRDYNQIADAIRLHHPFYVMTGFMPSGHPHLGHLMVMKEVVWHVRQGGTGSICIADREAHAVRDLSWDDCDRYAKEYLSCLFALGYTGKTYSQRKSRDLQDLCFEASTKVNFSELAAIYGFGPDTDLGHAISVTTQVADILYPQVAGKPAPTVVPVGLDQDPHIRLTRGIAHKMRMFTIEERDGCISVRSKNAPESAMDSIAGMFPRVRRCSGHIDIYDASCGDVKTQVRNIEIAHGGYGFVTPSATFHRFMPGLQGGKMSSSVPDSIIGFMEDETTVKKKVMGALTGGRQTLALQKEHGGRPDECPVFLLNLFHMIDDDATLAALHEQCIRGELMCGQCKKDTASRVQEFLLEFREKMDETEHLVQECEWL